MASMRVFVLGLLIVVSAGTVAHAYQPVPQPPTLLIRFDVVIADLNLPVDQREQVLKKLAAPWNKAKDKQLASSTGLSWTVTNVQAKATWDQLHQLRERNQAKFLACPRLVTKNGEKAQFLSGGQLPIQEPNENSPSGVRFENFGTTVSLTATLRKNDKLFLNALVECTDQVQKAPIIILAGYRTNTFAELSKGDSLFVLAPHSRVNQTSEDSSLLLFIITPHLEK